MPKATDDLRALIRDIPDFPAPGVLFRDITPLLRDGPAFRRVIDWLVERYRDARMDAVVAVESRGFILGAPLADRLGIGLVPVRKAGKLPAATHAREYVLEYGTAVLEMHSDALGPGQRAVIVDDLLATGGTALAAAKVVELTGARVAALAFLLELKALHGRDRLPDYQIDVLLPV